MKERLIAIDTDKVDPTLKPREMRLTFSTGRTEICHADDPKFAGRVFEVGMEKTDVQ